MCFLISKDPKYSIELKALQDITCWKAFYGKGFTLGNAMGKNEVCSYFQDFVYKKGKKYKVASLFVNKGWHASTIDIGFHSYTTRRAAREDFEYMGVQIVKCIIPKGSRYYYSPENKEYVSTALIVTE